VKRMHGTLAWGRDCSEWSNVGRIPAGVTARHGEAAMAGLKSVPHRICEETLWQVGHFQTYSRCADEVSLSLRKDRHSINRSGSECPKPLLG
jgi:hypothetical protein